MSRSNPSLSHERIQCVPIAFRAHRLPVPTAGYSAGSPPRPGSYQQGRQHGMNGDAVGTVGTHISFSNAHAGKNDFLATAQKPMFLHIVKGCWKNVSQVSPARRTSHRWCARCLTIIRASASRRRARWWSGCTERTTALPRRRCCGRAQERTSSGTSGAELCEPACLVSALGQAVADRSDLGLPDHRRRGVPVLIEGLEFSIR